MAHSVLYLSIQTPNLITIARMVVIHYILMKCSGISPFTWTNNRLPSEPPGRSHLHHIALSHHPHWNLTLCMQYMYSKLTVVSTQVSPILCIKIHTLACHISFPNGEVCLLMPWLWPMNLILPVYWLSSVVVRPVYMKCTKKGFHYKM